ncbi:putative Alanine--glyoxylate aminotransferase 1 [Glarea lozoyensis 74030]|uniref:Putative Alanine--glyoxylate aminotransferase 1 n=1 Tax=Glarea lozoyensis (strain ATCC 74030 / MF5533) TaxID=1104152 RepID=H0ED88_GLAL7|nr:putative Alanine--glyoxylate aminotransferase 1 [Glarea lozoyensis 74030]
MSTQPEHPTLLIPGPIEFDDAVLQSMSHYSVGSENIEFDNWKLDGVITASQKGIGCPAGLSISMYSGRAMDVFKSRKTPPGSYFASMKNWLPNQANGMTAIYLPEGVKAPELLPNLFKKGVVFAGGLHKEIAAKYIRFGHMGVSVTDPKRNDIDKAIKALETGLSDVGYQKA